MSCVITIHSILRASDSPTPDSGTIHYGANSNGNSNGARKASRVIIEEAPSNNTWQIKAVLYVKNKNLDIINSKRMNVCGRGDPTSNCVVCSENCDFPLTSLMQALTYSNGLQCCVEITIHFLYFLLLHWATNTKDLAFNLIIYD